MEFSRSGITPFRMRRDNSVSLNIKISSCLSDQFLQQPPDLRRQIADGQNLPHLLRQEQFAEVPL
jgi:hypothetical protein